MVVQASVTVIGHLGRSTASTNSLPHPIAVHLPFGYNHPQALACTRFHTMPYPASTEGGLAPSQPIFFVVQHHFFFAGDLICTRSRFKPTLGGMAFCPEAVPRPAPCSEEVVVGCVAVESLRSGHVHGAASSLDGTGTAPAGQS